MHLRGFVGGTFLLHSLAQVVRERMRIYYRTGPGYSLSADRYNYAHFTDWKRAKRGAIYYTHIYANLNNVDHSSVSVCLHNNIDHKLLIMSPFPATYVLS